MDKIGIVTGHPRSGTSLMMQILENGGILVNYDDSRKKDWANLKGYYELFGGKIINKLEKGEINFNQLKGKFTKIINYGLRFLPDNYSYKIIYIVRDRDELFMSMERMSGKKTDEKERRAFIQLDNEIVKILQKKRNVDLLVMDYNAILENPKAELENIKVFLEEEFDFNIEKAKEAVDPSLKTF